MANPKVEKLKDFGLRYGDKIAVALASVVFVLCLGMAFKRPTIDIKPEQIKKYAEQSESNISRRQDPEEILKILVEQGLQDSNFAKEAEESAKVLLVADDFRAAREWVMPEPGAGLIRDTPKLIAPANVYAYPGRGGALVYALDSEGNRILEAEKKEAPKSEPARRRRRRRAAGGGSSSMMGGMGGMMGGMGGMMGGAARQGGKSEAELLKEAKEDEARRKKLMQARLAGKDEPDAEDDAAKDQADKGPPPKEITKGLRWVAVTATLDHGQMLANYLEALKNPSAAQPYYSRLDVQRQELQSDGSWGEWEDVSLKRNRDIVDNLPETDEELTLDNVRPKNLNDPLPFLKAGLWEKVHIASLVPKEKKEVAPAQIPGGMGGMMGGGMGSMMGSGMGMGGGSEMMGRMMGGRGMGGMMGSGMGSMMGGGMGSMMGGGMDGEGGYMGGMGMGGGGIAGVDSITDFWKSEEKKVMVRALDFTADPDATYHYRLRIVVVNPNYKREDVSPGHDNKSKELNGPWSEPSNEVHMPSDVSAYAMGVLPSGAKSDMKVVFQVIKFNPEDGVTVPQNFEAAPGEIIGEPLKRDVPVSDGSGKKSKLIDFDTHQIVLDVDGGWQPMPTGFVGGGLPRPAMALLLRSDGAVMVRDEADDRLDAVRKDIASNYKRELDESTKERTSSMGGGYGGMMGAGMGSMMGGGMRGR